MKRWILCLLLLMALTACGRSDQSNAGPVTGGNDQPNGKLIIVHPEPEPIRPTSTPYIPHVNGTLVEIDMVQSALQPSIAVTMLSTQTLHLFSSETNLVGFEWGIQFDPMHIVASEDGKPLKSIVGYTLYDPNAPKNILLKPLGPGTSDVIVYLGYKMCTGCDTISPITTYTITVQ